MGISNKYRMHLVAYHRPMFNDYLEWALLLTPKKEDIHNLDGKCTLYHVIEKMPGNIWHFERKSTDSARTGSMLGRVTIGNVDHEDTVRLQQLLANPSRVRIHDPDWDREVWVEEAISDLVREGILETKVPVDVGHLMKYARQQGREIVERRLNVGYRLPPTSKYPGPIP